MQTTHIPFDKPFKFTQVMKEQLAEGLQPEAICNLIDHAWVVWRNVYAETIQMFVLPYLEDDEIEVTSVGHPFAESDCIPTCFTFPLADLFDEATIVTAMHVAFQAGKVYEAKQRDDVKAGDLVQVMGSDKFLQF